MPRSHDEGRRPRIICLSLMLLGLLAPGLALAKVQPPVSTSLQLLTSPTLGGQCQVIWAAVPDLTPVSATLTFFLTTPDGQTTSSTRPLNMTAGRVTDASLTLATPLPGTYKIGTHLLMITRGGRFGKSDILNVVVPERGRAYLAPLPVLSAKQYAARAPARHPPLTATPGAAAATAVSTLQGAYRFTNKTFDKTGFTGTRLDPIRRATVQIIQTNHGVSTTTLGTTRTDETGAFSFTLPGGTGGAIDLIVRLVAQTDVVNVIDLTNSMYFSDIPVTNWNGGVLNLGTTNLPLAQSGPWNIYDAILQGSDFARAITKTDVPSVRCRWAVGNTDGTYFMHANYTISILGSEMDSDEFDDAVILHEYGHFIAATYSKDKSPGGSHSWTSHISPQLAWSEGWATFYSSAVRGWSYYVDTSIYGVMAIDLEQPTDDVTGDDNEGAVAATLWDIFDSHNDGQDHLSDGFSNVWYVFTHYFTIRQLCVIRDFFDGWIASNRSHVIEVENIFAEHGINYPKIIVTSMLINNGAARTNATTVTLNNTCIGDPAAFMASENANFTGAAWKPWAAAPAFGLSSRQGNKGVYFKVRNSAGEESATVVDEIVQGVIPITPMTINGPSILAGVVSEFDYAIYSFTITTAGQYTIDTVAGTLTDSLMDLYGPNSQTTLIEENDDGHGPLDYMSRISRTFQPGTYYVKIKGFAAELGTYSVWLVSGAGDPLMRQILVNGPTVNGSISNDRNILENWFRFIVTSTGPYTIQTTPGTLYDTIMTLYGPNSQTAQLELDDDGGRGYMSMISRTLTPGIYYVKVTSFSNTLSGDFNIQLYSGLRGAVTPVAVNGPTVGGVISTTTLGNDFNWFAFTVTVPGSYQIETLAGTMKNDYLYIYGPDNPEKFLFENGDTTNGGMATVPLTLNPGKYYIKVEGYLPDHDVGTYRLRVRCTIQGTKLGTTGAWNAAEISTKTPYTWFQFTVPATGDYLIETSPRTLTDTVMILYGPDDPLKQIARNDDVDVKDHMSRLALPLRAGTYYVRIEGYQDAHHSLSVGTYLMRAVRIPYHASTPLIVGAPPVAAAISLKNEMDWFSFRISTRGKYIIQTRPGTLHGGYLRLFGPDSQITLAGQDGGPDRMGRILASLEPGYYYVRMQAYQPDSMGSYTIQVRPEITPLTLNAPALTQNLDSSSTPEWFSFAVPETGSYTLQTGAGTLRNDILRLYGPGSPDMLIAQGDSASGSLAQLTRTLTPGTYYAAVQGNGAGDTGTFTIGARQDVPPLEVGAPVTWSAIDPAGDSDWFTFHVANEETYTIETWAGSLTDNYLRLYGPDSTTALLAQNDNSGSGSMAKISLKLKPGQYTIRVNAHSADGRGTYRIQVRR